MIQRSIREASSPALIIRKKREREENAKTTIKNIDTSSFSSSLLLNKLNLIQSTSVIQLHSEACLQLCSGLERGNRFELQYEVHIRCMALDEAGILLALGHEDGVLIIDFTKESNAAKNRATISHGELARYALDGPVSTLAWHTSSKFLLIAMVHTSLIFLADITKLSPDSFHQTLIPDKTLGPINGTQGGGHHCVSFGTNDIVLAGAHCGLMRGWEPRINYQGSFRYWDLSVALESQMGPGGHRHRPPVISIATTLNAEVIAVTANSLSMFDLAKRDQKAFGTSVPKPSRIWTRSSAELFAIPQARFCSMSTARSQRNLILAAQLTFDSLCIHAVALINPSTATILAVFLADKPSVGPFLAIPFCHLALRHCTPIIATCKLQQTRSSRRGGYTYTTPPSGLTLCRLTSSSGWARCQKLNRISQPKEEIFVGSSSVLLLSSSQCTQSQEEIERERLETAISNSAYSNLLFQEDISFSPLDETCFNLNNPASSTIIALAAHPSTGQVLTAYDDGSIVVMEPV
uniref:Uncharacterized protein n=1 Tax=Aureoumbra lagunensis TaxID=44058 RepID=A0A7S3NHK0_9STRA|mmetsp:Transcript_19052/g.28800  ORF Transcript_19052/g.28800 Transcript_19052/m.28800 type:complete len:521 (+) Transcript_19052:7-1569(+)